jgi:tetratricopeptide (TPR) repeat protein
VNVFIFTANDNQSEDKTMKRLALKVISVLLLFALAAPGTVGAQEKILAPGQTTEMLAQAYDLMQEGKLDQALEIYKKVLEREPNNPLALNNQGAVLVKQQKYAEALTYLTRALTTARGYRVKINQVCDVDGLCLAFRPSLEAYGDRDLQPLVRLNLELVKAKLAAEKK